MNLTHLVDSTDCSKDKNRWMAYKVISYPRKNISENATIHMGIAHLTKIWINIVAIFCNRKILKTYV